MGRKKVKLPMREGTRLPPLTEEERLQRRTIGHPLDDFPVTSRMSQWREVRPVGQPDPTTTERLNERSVEHSSNAQNELTESEISLENKNVNINQFLKTQDSFERLNKRSIELLTEPFEHKQTREAYVALDATHTASEAKVYSLLYRLSINRGQPTCRASLTGIQESLGLSKNTIIKALRGLVEKLSVDVLDRRAGSKIGSLYYVYNVKDILTRRKEAGIEIDDFKQVVPKGSIKRSIERLIERSKIEPLNVQNLNVQMNVQSPTNLLKEDALTLSRWETKNLLLRNDDNSIESSSNGDDETERLGSIRTIYCDITMNEWREQDETAAKTIEHVNLSHIILGICYSLDRAPNHRISTFKYCIPSILDHYEAMKAFPEKALFEIAYAHMMRLKHAMRNNHWDGNQHKSE